MRHIKISGDRANVFILVLEGERRRARSDLEAIDPRERVDDLFRDPVAEELVLRVGAHVHEREDRDAFPRTGPMTREVALGRYR